MTIRRIELDGAVGHVAIERPRGSDMIRIDSILHESRGKQAWKTWTTSSRTVDPLLIAIAVEVQHRTEGFAGTNGDVGAYFKVIQQFQD